MLSAVHKAKHRQTHREDVRQCFKVQELSKPKEKQWLGSEHISTPSVEFSKSFTFICIRTAENYQMDPSLPIADHSSTVLNGITCTCV